MVDGSTSRLKAIRIGLSKGIPACRSAGEDDTTRKGREGSAPDEPPPPPQPARTIIPTSHASFLKGASFYFEVGAAVVFPESEPASLFEHIKVFSGPQCFFNEQESLAILWDRMGYREVNPGIQGGAKVAGHKIIAVVGATGMQGSGLCRAVLQDKDGGYKVRALTRNPDSEKAKELKRMGAEVMAADLDDVESLKKAFHCVHAAFCVTFFWEHFSPEKELAHAKNMADAAREDHVGHVIWSTLEDTRDWVPLEDDRMPTLLGRYKVPHFDAKGEADAFFTERGLPVTFLRTSFYWDNLIHFGMGPRKGADGELGITFPMGDRKLPGIAAEDIGRCAYNIIKNRNEFLGKTVGIAGDHLTGTQMAEALTKALGRKIRYNDVPPEVYRGFGFPGAEDLGNMFQFKRDFEHVYCGARDLEAARRLHPGMKSFDRWLAENGHRIPLEEESRRASGE
jgi:uncharacterized protein YbjT (DUF2867 family)